MDEATLRSMLPTGFGAQATDAVSLSDSDSDSEREYLPTETQDEEPVPEKSPSPKPTHDPNGGRTAEFAGLPLAERVALRDHAKTVSALAIDVSGTRIASGAHDYQVRLWDFGGMTSAFRPFRMFEPAENYPVVALDFSPVSRNLLCVNATTQPRVYDFQGDQIATYRKGDVYMRDMKHTTGHVSEMSAGMWHPTDAYTFLTAGTDSTVRIWDAEREESQKSVLVVRSKVRGTKTKVTTATYTPDARIILAAGLDGALYLWSTSSSFARPHATVEHACAPGTWTSSIAVSPDSRFAATRAKDSVKLWDLRSMRQPLASRDDVPSGDDQANLVYSPDGKQLLAGTAAVPNASSDEDSLASSFGQLAVFDAADLSVQHVHHAADSSIVRVAWQPRINQVLASTRDGAILVFYDPEASQLGATLGVAKRARDKSNPFGIDLKDGIARDIPIFIPEEEENEFEEVRPKKRPYVPGPRPERPLDGHGRGGRIGVAAQQHIVQGLMEDGGKLRIEDPREALLKYAEKAEKDPRWTSVYAKTQPKPIFAKDTEKSEE
ncbi:hypothetical protein MVES1_003075 [Malassezia vespertilionis]|uniref:Uncharacterized protein n=1 Tax=Malassezia vespertilionis TaxID=2020962 RepID=A0A2N1J9M3_9BASI|nr:uncharacterized protein MVES1_003075 [Malassezia vespertilionis]PKI83253.1 hypothetical protein MVES_002915 [Malassezia vespertilionis]WFD07705.1 hypothetical protein MVES1_003075 [Malassezia vespertilionis]